MSIYPTMGLILLLPMPAMAADRPELPKPLRWTINGERREALVIFPDAPRTKPAPVVFVFHGHGSTMEAFARRWDVHKLWPAAVAVYMQGLPTASRVDPKGKKAGWQSLAGTEGDRDLKFVDAVLKTVHEKHAIDDDRVYATGQSNGGGFTYVLWSARPGIFAVYAPCSAILRYPEDLSLKPGAVLHIAGETDQTAPFEMQLKSMAEVRKINGCTNAPIDWGADCKLYPRKTNSGAPFVSFIHPGGHGPPPHAFETIIKFFKQHPRRHSKPAADG
jgi:polyhydroxybutyrate depolymerase